MAKNVELRKYAELLIDKDYSVTPTHDKNPGFKDWQITCGEKILESRYDYLWNKANGLGVLTGEPSGIICLDIDILEGDERLLEVREELLAMLPPAYCGVVGNNKKPAARFYKYNGETNEKFISIDVELLSTGNQKVIPPSIHPLTNEKYKWVNNSLESVDLDEMPALPDGILNYLRNRNEEFRLDSKGAGMADVALTSEKGRSKHGSHNYISKKALRFFHQGYKFEDIVDALLDIDKSLNCNEDALYFLCPSRKDFRSKNSRVNAVKFVSELVCRNIYRRYEENDFFKEEIANGFTISIETKPGSGTYKNIRQHISLYNFLKIKHDPWYCPEIKSFQLWDGKKYNTESEDYLRWFAQKHFKNPVCVSIGDKSTFLDYAKNEQQSKVKDFNLRDTGLVNFKNGVYNFKTKSLVKHNKKYKMPYVIDVNYTDQSEAPIWDTLLEIITVGKPHMQTAIEEFIGYAISGCSYNRFNKLLILDGAGSNGKSTLIRIIQMLIGEDNTASTGLEAISKERFAGHNLVNKLINFCSEEPREAFSNTGILKKLTGGDSIMVEEKHKGAFQYNNLAKFIISYNKMPFFPDDSLGMRRRIMLIPCTQNFEKNPSLKIKNVEARIAKAELPAILARCVAAFNGVLSRGHFTEVVEGDARVEKMIVESNSILEFIEECVTTECKTKKDFLSTSWLWQEFLEFTGKKTKYTKNRFSKELKINLLKIDGVSYDKNPKRGYYGVGLD